MVRVDGLDVWIIINRIPMIWIGLDRLDRIEIVIEDLQKGRIYRKRLEAFHRYLRLAMRRYCS